MCKIGAGAGSSVGADTQPKRRRRRRDHEWTDDQAGRRRVANTDADEGRGVHATNGTPSKNAASRARHCNFMRRGG